jgi:hypothetical protein
MSTSSVNNEAKRKKVMKDIENKTERMVILAYQTGNLVNPIDIINKNNIPKEKINDSENLLQNMMKAGANEFKEKTGRQMTYSEMREMYG